ncbi:MAG: UDP-N-acetylmuramoyl-L-alanine--D-glutamate ligase [Verrucomicrobiota bacterium]
MELNGKKTVVLGLGISGMQAATFLRSKGADVLVRDNGESAALRERASTLAGDGICTELGADVADTADFDLAVLSPGIPLRAPLVTNLTAAGVPVIGELELAARDCACPMVAVTGTNGKTTTTELIAAALRVAGRRTGVAGNIGTAFTQAVAESDALDAMVLEVSSFQLEATREFRPGVSVMLNLTPDHLDHHASLEEYRAAKMRIFHNQTEDDVAVVNAELELPADVRARVVRFSAYGRDADYTLADGTLLARGEPVMKQEETNLFGLHNAENLLAALAAVEAMGADRAAAVGAFRAYRPQPHRCEPVGDVNGVRYLNDSKATNIDALDKALLSMTRPVVLIAGGKDKGLDFAPLTKLVGERCRHVLLTGETAPKLMELWGQAFDCERCDDLAAAVARARELARPGDIVLYSPGCSSFDAYANYAERGNHFRRLVEELAAKETN